MRRRFWRFQRSGRFQSWRLPPLDSTPLFRDPEVLDKHWTIICRNWRGCCLLEWQDPLGPLSRLLMAGFLYRDGAETTPNVREKFRVSLRTILKNSQRWIPKPQFWYPPLRFGSQHRIPEHLFFLGFRVYTADFGFLPGNTFFLRCLSRKFGSQHQLHIRTIPSIWQLGPL